MTPTSTLSEPLDERKFVVALARGLDLLRAFKPGETMLGNRDFVERTGLPKATVNRLAYTLTVLGYLRLDEIARQICARCRRAVARFRAALGHRHARTCASAYARVRARGGRGGVARVPRRARHDLSGDDPQRNRADARPRIRFETVDADEFDGARVPGRAAGRCARRVAGRTEEGGRRRWARRWWPMPKQEIDAFATRALLLFVSRVARRCQRGRGAVSRAARRALAGAQLQRAGVVDGRGCVSRERRAASEGARAAAGRAG